jgi:hypothetical protein
MTRASRNVFVCEIVHVRVIIARANRALPITVPADQYTQTFGTSNFAMTDAASEYALETIWTSMRPTVCIESTLPRIVR